MSVTVLWVTGTRTGGNAVVEVALRSFVLFTLGLTPPEAKVHAQENNNCCVVTGDAGH